MIWEKLAFFLLYLLTVHMSVGSVLRWYVKACFWHQYTSECVVTTADNDDNNNKRLGVKAKNSSD